MSNSFCKYGIFLIIPVLILGFSILLKLAAGPYCLATNLDPSYQYLVNGLYLLKGFVPNHTDHPGTPLQILCGVVCWSLNIGRPTGDIVRNVLIAPEFYLNAIFVVLSLFASVTSSALAVYVYRKTGDRWGAVLTQLPALSFLVLKSWETVEPVLPVVANVNPEPLLISIVNLFNVFLLMYFFAKTPKDESVATVWWGFVSGLGVAVKLTFIPILAIPLIVLSWKNRVIFVMVVMASFFVWTLPILSKYSIIEGWISGIAMHKGAHGPQGIGLFVISLLAIAVFIFWKRVGKKWDRGTSFLAATVVGVCLQCSVVTQHPGAHYLLPGIGLLSVLLFLLYWQWGVHRVLGRRIALAFILISILSGAWQANSYRLKLEGLTNDILDFHNHISSEYQNCIFIDYYRSSSQSGGLFFGDGWNLSPRLGEDLFRVYPNKFYYNLWGHHVLDFNGTVWTNDLLAHNSCVLFRGDGGSDFSSGPYNLQLIEKGRFETIQLLTGTTEKQAALCFTGALQFIQAGDYAKAMAFLLQARNFHYQPDSSVESLMQMIKH